MKSAKLSQSPTLNGQLERLQRRLEVWRKSHKPRSQLPRRLWKEAGRLAGHYGLNKTAKVLRLDYYDLKKRVDANAGPLRVFLSRGARENLEELARKQE